MPKIQAITVEMLAKSKNVLQGAAEIMESQNRVMEVVRNLGRDFSGKMPALMTGNLLAIREKY